MSGGAAFDGRTAGSEHDGVPFVIPPRAPAVNAPPRPSEATAEGRSAHAQAHAQRRKGWTPCTRFGASMSRACAGRGPYFFNPSIIARTIAICGPVFFAKSGLSYPQKSQHPSGFVPDFITCGYSTMTWFASAHSFRPTCA